MLRLLRGESLEELSRELQVEAHRLARGVSKVGLSCAGASKANTALLHTGFDAKPGTLEARLVRRGHQLMRERGPALGIPIELVGALLVAWTEEQLAALPGIAERAAANSWPDVRPLTVEELYRREPHLARAPTARWKFPARASSARSPRRSPSPPKRSPTASSCTCAAL